MPDSAIARAATGEVQELNRVSLLSPMGMEVASYDKLRLLPFGEYVPFASLLGRVREPPRVTLAAGTDATIFTLPKGRFGVLICFEAMLPALARHLVRGGADFLVNPTNDVWFDDPGALSMLLVHAQMRAIEHRRPVVRVANRGISAFIEPTGHVRWASAPFAALWHAETISHPDVTTIYTRWGDVFVLACALLTATLAWRGSPKQKGDWPKPAAFRDLTKSAGQPG